jgi:hypothetical protein
MMGVTGKRSRIGINCITDCVSVVLPTKTTERRKLLLTLSLGKPRSNTEAVTKTFGLFIYVDIHYISLHYITLHYITLHYITLHYITLHYIILPVLLCRYELETSKL